MSKRTIEHKGSSMAGYTCFSRACAAREKDERFRGPDDLAEIFLPGFAKTILEIPVLRKFFMKKVAPPGIYEYVMARTKLLDEIYVNALEDGFSQIVLLGAGMDTRALRFKSRNKGTRIFELDIETTQRPKIDILTRKGVVLPRELALVPIDFNKQRLSGVLFDAGYEDKQKTLFMWEGVTMYLTSEAVDRTLGFIQDHSGEGSVVVFDYVSASVLRGEGRFFGEKEIVKTVSRAGEGWAFGIEDGEIERFLSERGFKMTSHYTPSDLESIYLTADDGYVFGRVNGTHRVVTASVSHQPA